MPADLSRAFVTAPSPTMRYGQGRILAWNADTFENVIEWQGQRIENLGVVGTTDALSYQPGQTVALHGMDADGSQGNTQWWIAGRILVPGTDNAEQVVDFLRGSIARAIAADIFAARIFSDSDTNGCFGTNTSFGDPTTGDPGPIVTGVPVSSTGMAIIDISAQSWGWWGDGLAQSYGGFAGVAISGATTVIAEKTRALTIANDASAGVDARVTASLSKRYVVTGLNEGLHDFRMVYCRDPIWDQYAFDDRELSVTGL